MYNLLLAFAAGALAFLATHLGGFSWWAGIVPGLIAFVGAFILLARRVGLKVQALSQAAQKELSAQPSNARERQVRIDKAIGLLQQGLVFEKWQILIGSEIHAQIGMIKYMTKDLDGAREHLSKASARNYMALALQGALHYQRKEYPAMERAFEAATRSGKKEPIAWAAYAWCLHQLKEKEKALRVLARGVESNPSDEKLKGALSALQNDKKLKMRAFEPMWWQFGLEAPPPMDMGGGRRPQFQRR
jgi:tetratricopeptide (TPR) repeat protein